MSESQGGSKDAKFETESRKTSVWDRWQGKLGVPIFTLILGSVITVSIASWNNRLRTIEYIVVPTSSLIQRPELGGKQFTVMIDGKSVDNLSTVTLYLVNRSNKDFENLPVEISFAHPDDSPVDLLQETIQPLRRAGMAGSSTQPARVLTLTYRLDVANRSTNNEALFKAEYVFAGSTAPNVNVVIPKAGVVAEEQKVLGKEDISWLFSAAVALFFGLLFERGVAVVKWAFETGKRMRRNGFSGDVDGAAK